VRNELLRCCRCSNVIRIMYMNDDAVVTERTVRVLKINSTTFKTFCYMRGAQRTFRIDNLLAVVPIYERVVV